MSQKLSSAEVNNDEMMAALNAPILKAIDSPLLAASNSTVIKTLKGSMGPPKTTETSKFREFMSPAIIVYYLRIISKPHAYLQTMSKTTVKLRTQGTHYLFTLIVKTLKND